MAERDPMLDRRRPTDEELEAEARITQEDIEEAVRAFNRHAPGDAHGLLDAVPTDDDDSDV